MILGLAVLCQAALLFAAGSSDGTPEGAPSLRGGGRRLGGKRKFVEACVGIEFLDKLKAGDDVQHLGVGLPRTIQILSGEYEDPEEFSTYGRRIRRHFLLLENPAQRSMFYVPRIQKSSETRVIERLYKAFLSGHAKWVEPLSEEDKEQHEYEDPEWHEPCVLSKSTRKPYARNQNTNGCLLAITHATAFANFAGETGCGAPLMTEMSGMDEESSRPERMLRSFRTLEMLKPAECAVQDQEKKAKVAP
jgi:hypothetical protein